MKKSIFKAALIFCMILCLASGLAVFSACTVGQKDAGEDTSGTVSGDSDSDGDNTVDNDGGDTSGDSDNTGDNTGDETGDNTGDNTGDDTGTPPAEITEEQYAVMCKEKLNEIALNALNNSAQYGEMTNIIILKINNLDSTVYCQADYHLYGLDTNRVYVITFNKNIISGESYEEIYNNLINIDNLTAEVIWQSRLQPEISEELFNEFCEYIKRQSYTYGEEVIDFSATDPQNLEIINVTNVTLNGNRRDVYIIILNHESNQMYTSEIKSYIMSSSTADQIIELMSKTSNLYIITEISEFQEFELSA